MAILTTIYLYIYTFFAALLPGVSYNEGMLGQPQTFLPSQVVQQTDKAVSSLLYRGLFKYDIYGATVPDLAETWQVSDDGLVYTIRLKDNQLWTNGRKINSDDLIYTSFKVTDLSGVATDKVDDMTVRYTLPNKYSPFLSLLTVGIMPRDSEENNDPLHPVTSGGFRVARIEKSGKYIRQINSLTWNENSLSLKGNLNSNEKGMIVDTAAKLGEI